MPLPMVHLGVAHRILAQRVHIGDAGQFYLGSIAPDAIHVRPDSSAHDKNRSHLRSSAGTLAHHDYGPWRDAILDLWRRSEKDAFLAGYCVHLLTDIHWGQTQYRSFELAYQSDPAPAQEKRWAYYNDADQLDFELYGRCPWQSAVWDALKRANGRAVPGLVSAAEVDAWKARTLHWYDGAVSRHQNPIRYMTFDGLSAFIGEAARVIAPLIGPG